MLTSWIPIVGTLLGTIIGGAISFLAQKLAARYAREIQTRNMAEERARWVVEKQLVEMKSLYKQLADFIDVTAEFRIHKAREVLVASSEISASRDSEEYNLKRERWENTLKMVLADILMFDVELHEKFKQVLRPRTDWFMAKDGKEALDCLIKLEENLQRFAEDLAGRYREVFLRVSLEKICSMMWVEIHMRCVASKKLDRC